MDLVALGQIGHRRLFSIRFQQIFAFKAPSILRLIFVIVCSVYQTERPISKLSSWSQKRDLFHLLMIARLIEARKLSICLEWRSTTRKSARRVG